MAGHVRAKGKCPKCGKTFQEIRPLGYVCLECQTVPRRFYVDLSWKNERIRIFSDKTGQVLDSYDRAERIRGHIQFEIDNRIFDPSKYVEAEASKFYAMLLLDQFEKAKIDGIAPSYKKDYRRMIAIAKGFFKDEDVREIANSKIRIVAFMNHCIEKFNWSEKTLKNTIDLFRVFMNWLKSDDMQVIDKVPGFPTINVPEPCVAWIQEDDRDELYELVNEEDKPFIGFLFLHPCRPGEARAIKCKDANLEGRIPYIHIHATFSRNVYRPRRKGRNAKPYDLTIQEPMLEYIKERVRSAHPEAFMFVNPRTGGPYSQEAYLRVWKTAREKGRIPDEIKLYGASRHSIASQLGNENVPAHRIGKALGHSQQSRCTLKYVHSDLVQMQIDLARLKLGRRESVTKVSLDKKRGA